MKKIISFLLINLFFSNFALAISSLDYVGKKQSDMDNNYECINHRNEKEYIAYKKVKDNLFKYNYWPDAKALDGTIGSTGMVDSSVKKFELSLNNQKFILLMDFLPVWAESNFKNGIILEILIESELKEFGIQRWTYWVKNNSAKKANEMEKKWKEIVEGETEDNFDQSLYKWSTKAYEIVSKELDFGKPFELVDLETINKDGLHLHENGNYLTFISKCKKL